MRRFFTLTMLLLLAGASHGVAAATEIATAPGEIDVHAADRAAFGASSPRLLSPPPVGPAPTFRAMEGTKPSPPSGERPASFEFPAPRALDLTYSGAADRIAAVTEAVARPTALAAARFDGDPFEDLIVGYAAAGAHALVLHRGNPDALFPDSPDARARKASGTFSADPFLRPARVFALDAAPDFLAAGDFDGDDRADVVSAARGGSVLTLLPGDGAGGFGPARIVALAGTLTAMISGEINRVDGRADLVVGVVDADGPAALVFESGAGAFDATPERIALPAPASDLALARLDGDHRDLAVAAGRELLRVSGRDRKTWLRPALRGEIAPAEIATLAAFDSPIRSIATGDYLWHDPPRRSEIAALTADGTLHVVGRATEAGPWTTLGSRAVAVGAEASGRLLVTARMSGLPMDEVVVIDRVGLKLHAALGEVPPPAVEKTSAGALAAPLTRALERAPLAAVPMRLDRNGLADLVLLQDGMTAPAVASSPAAVIVVDVPSGFIDGGPIADGLCQLSEAIDNANLNGAVHPDCAPGSGPGDVITFAMPPGGVALLGVAPHAAVSYGLPSYTLIGAGDGIDGFSQGCAGAPCIHLDGGLVGHPDDGLKIRGPSTVVRGLAITGFGADGVDILPGGDGAGIFGNFVGLTPAGAPAGNAGEGIRIVDSCCHTIGGFGPPPPAGGGGNVISAQPSGNGIALFESVIGFGGSNEIRENYVGTDPLGAAAVGNRFLGVFLGPTDDNLVERNLASGNGSDGIGTGSTLANRAERNFLVANRTGTNLAGTSAIPNAFAGIGIEGRSNRIDRNLASGNSTHGIVLYDSGVGGPSGNLVIGNFAGTDAAGSAPIGNTFQGIVLFDAPSNDVVGNLASGNFDFGIAVGAFAGPFLADGNRLVDNWCGLDASGTAALPNAFSGIIVQDASATEIASNTSSGNPEVGLLITTAAPFAATGNTVRGNFFGTDPGGTIDLGNGFDGIVIDASGNTVGGPNPGDGNLLSGNDRAGIIIQDFAGDGASGNVVEGNRIGTDASGTAPLPNGSGFGFGVGIADASSNRIGGTCNTCGNRIWFNGPNGGIATAMFAPFPAMGNVFLRNSVTGNGGPGIDIALDGVSPNDGAGDPDAGPNGTQNFPDLLQADIGPGEIEVAGDLDSLASTTFRVELFRNASCDPLLHGEGREFIGAISVTTDGAGLGPFSAIVPTTAVSSGDAITATATGPDGTSEFSECFPSAPCASLASFPFTVLAADKNTLDWGSATDGKFAKMALSAVGSYTVSDSGPFASASTLDITADTPSSGAGFAYVLRELGCASWQTSAGAEPDRDVFLP